MACTYSDRQVARHSGVTPDWIEFIADVLNKLHRKPAGRFSGKELFAVFGEVLAMVDTISLLTANTCPEAHMFTSHRQP